MGATGNIGSVVAQDLIQRGHEVRALGRNKRKLEAMEAFGAKPYPVDLDQPASLAKAFKGANAVFSLIPPFYEAEDFGAAQDRAGESIVKAISEAQNPYVLNLSSLGAHLSEGTGPIKGLYRHEQRLNQLKDVNIMHLRPIYFMENQLAAIPLIKAEGINGSPLKGDHPIPIVATHDIGLKAAEFLDRLDFQGINVFELIGPEAVSLEKVTSALGEAIGKPDLRYFQFPYDEAKKAMLESGLKPNVVDLLLEMDKSFNEGKIQPTQELTEDHQGSMTIQDFAPVFASVYESMA